MSWFHIPKPQVTWLVDGLIPADGHAAVCGKPKAGKSTFIRNLIVSVVTGREFLGRSIDLPAGTGRVLYVHLDRKDQPWQVAQDLRELGITQGDADRVTLKTAEDVPFDTNERLQWLGKNVVDVHPNLIVIDLLWQFVSAKNANDYTAVIDGINALQDVLTQIGYKGALVVALHSRKATNANDPADDILGSTAQRGSFGTNIFLTRYRKEGVYTILSEQTLRDEHFGEIDETVITRTADRLELGQSYTHIAMEQKQVMAEAQGQRVLNFIKGHSGCEISDITQGLGMSKKTVLDHIRAAPALVRTAGAGKKGDPHRYHLKNTINDPQAAAQAVAANWAN